jgi:hypothetical protein
MIQPPPRNPVLDELGSLLQLQQSAPDQAFCQIRTSPVTMTILNMEPLGLLFAYRVLPTHSQAIELPAEVDQFVRECSGEVSIERGHAWLSLDNLDGRPAADIAALLDRFDAVLEEAGVHVPTGCVHCGSDEDPVLVYADRRCSRLCIACRHQVEENAADRQADVDRPSVLFAAGMPAVFLGVSALWAAVWFGIDLVMIARGTNQLWVAYYDLLLILAFLAVVAAVLGYPLGVFLRRSGLARRKPVAIAIAATVAACLFGEWLFVNAIIVHQFGVVDPIAATRFFVPYVTGYSPSWIFGKLLMAAAIGGGASLAAIMRPFVQPKV